MTTTLVTRETTRDGIAALFVADGSWQKVFSYIPTEDEIDGQEPFLIIMSAGTEQGMEGTAMNPTKYMFILTSLIKMDDTDVGGSSGAAAAENKLDELDLKFRQIVRNSIETLSFANNLTFADGQSQTDTIELYRKLYRTEMWVLTAHHYSGGA